MIDRSHHTRKGGKKERMVVQRKGGKSEWQYKKREVNSGTYNDCMRQRQRFLMFFDCCKPVGTIHLWSFQQGLYGEFYLTTWDIFFLFSIFQLEVFCRWLMWHVTLQSLAKRGISLWESQSQLNIPFTSCYRINICCQVFEKILSRKYSNFQITEFLLIWIKWFDNASIDVLCRLPCVCHHEPKLTRIFMKHASHIWVFELGVYWFTGLFE